MFALLASLLGATSREAACKPRCEPRDEYVPLEHGDGGGVFIPRELACGGNAHVIVMLHGNNGNKVPRVSLGGGRHLEEIARRLLDEGKILPVVLAEPVHFRVCWTGLYNDSFDFPGYRRKLERLLAERRIRVRSYSVTGHSGAGCCGGVYRAARAFAPLRFLGLIDTCYGSDDFFQDPHELFDGRGTIVLNASRGEPFYTGYRRFEEAFLGRAPLAVGCNTLVYRRCMRSALRPYYSFTTIRTDPRYHEEIPYDFFRTMLLRFFAGQGRAPATQGTE